MLTQHAMDRLALRFGPVERATIAARADREAARYPEGRTAIKLARVETRGTAWSDDSNGDTVADMEGQFRGRGDPRVGDRGRGQHLGPAVDAGHRHEPIMRAAARDQRERDVGPAGPHVQHRDPGPPRGQGIDRGRAQSDAAESTVDAGEVAQVPDERPLIVERAVESFPYAGQSVHPPPDYDAPDMFGRRHRRRPVARPGRDR